MLEGGILEKKKKPKPVQYEGFDFSNIEFRDPFMHIAVDGYVSTV